MENDILHIIGVLYMFNKCLQRIVFLFQGHGNVHIYEENFKFSEKSNVAEEQLRG